MFISLFKYWCYDGFRPSVEVENLRRERHSNACLFTFPWINCSGRTKVVIISPQWTSSPSPVPGLQAFVLSQGPVWSPSQRSQLQKRHSVSPASSQWSGSGRGWGCRCRTPQWPPLGRPQDSGSWENSAAKPSAPEWKRYLSCRGLSRGPHEGRSEKVDTWYGSRVEGTMSIQADDPWHWTTLFLLLWSNKIPIGAADIRQKAPLKNFPNIYSRLGRHD